METKMIYFLQQVSDMFEDASCDKQDLRFRWIIVFLPFKD